MTIPDTLSRIAQIQYQLASLGGAFVPGSTSSADSNATTSTGSASFAAQLSAATATGGASSSPGTPSSPVTPSSADVGGSSAGAALSGLSMTASLSGTGALSAATAPASSVSAPALSAAATSALTSDQRQFASRLAGQTGLNINVVAAWLLAEESGGAAQSRQANNNNDWLNIGYTDSATYGAADSVWSNPMTAADATAGWLKGQDTIPGYGTASAGIRAILSTAGQSPSAQIAALQSSGWASSGYPDLPALLQQVTG